MKDIRLDRLDNAVAEHDRQAALSAWSSSTSQQIVGDVHWMTTAAAAPPDFHSVPYGKDHMALDIVHWPPPGTEIARRVLDQASKVPGLKSMLRETWETRHTPLEHLRVPAFPEPAKVKGTMCFRAGFCACEAEGGTGFAMAKAFSSVFGKILRQPPVPKGTKRPPPSPPRLAYNMCRVVVHIFPVVAGQAVGGDLWLHIGFGNLASNDFTALAMVVVSELIGGRRSLRQQGGLLPRSHYHFVRDLELLIDWDMECMEIDDSPQLMPIPFVPSSIRVRPAEPGSTTQVRSGPLRQHIL